jgi:hypothetical protein
MSELAFILHKRLHLNIEKAMNEHRAICESAAPQWRPQNGGVRTLAIRGTVTLSAGDESKTADGEIIVVQHDPRSASEDASIPTNWRLRTAVAFSDILADVAVDFRNEYGIHLRSTAFLSAINSTGVGYTGKTALDGLVGAGLFPPPPVPKVFR